MRYFYDRFRHLVCIPYSRDNLHAMAADLGIKRCWFDRDHYDIPKRRYAEIVRRCELVSPRVVLGIIGERK